MPINKLLSVILFDLGRVILPFDIHVAASKFAKQSRISSEEIVRKIMGTPLDRAFEEGKVLPEEFYQEVKQRTGLNMAYDHFVAIWNDIFNENRKVSAIARQLKRKYAIAIISNTNILHFSFVYQKFSIVREVGHFILSYQVGVRKPDPKIYQVALEQFHARPQQVLYIDDREDFIVAGRELGLHGIHFKGEEQLEAELLTLNLLTS